MTNIHDNHTTTNNTPWAAPTVETAAPAKRSMRERVFGRKPKGTGRQQPRPSRRDAVSHHDAVLDRHRDILHRALDGKTMTVEGVELVETRTQTVAVGASKPIKSLGGLRLGGGAPISRSTMTVIDTGTIVFDTKGASFMGGKQSRRWEWRKLTGVNTSGANELLIGVTNRQRVSGIRYPQQYDALIDFIVDAYVAVGLDDTDAVETITAQVTPIGGPRIDPAVVAVVDNVRQITDGIVETLNDATLAGYADEVARLRSQLVATLADFDSHRKISAKLIEHPDGTVSVTIEAVAA